MIRHYLFFQRRRERFGVDLRYCRFEGRHLFGALPIYVRQLEWPS